MTYKEGANRENYKSGAIKDICQTPGYALEPLAFAPDFGYLETVWECASGQGYLVDALRDVYRLRVRATDLSDGYDFLSWEPSSSEVYDCIITNPPFADRISFVTRCIELGKPWALLMPTETVSLKKFHALVEDLSPQLGIIWFSPRVNFKMPYKKWAGSSYFPVAWFTWNMGFEGNMYKRMDHWTKEYRQGFEI